MRREVFWLGLEGWVRNGADVGRLGVGDCWIRSIQLDSSGLDNYRSTVLERSQQMPRSQALFLRGPPRPPLLRVRFPHRISVPHGPTRFCALREFAFVGGGETSNSRPSARPSKQGNSDGHTAASCPTNNNLPPLRRTVSC